MNPKQESIAKNRRKFRLFAQKYIKVFFSYVFSHKNYVLDAIQ